MQTDCKQAVLLPDSDFLHIQVGLPLPFRAEQGNRQFGLAQCPTSAKYLPQWKDRELVLTRGL
jgi:hypothetical protein